jgi:sec-independent protein translocase protein TatA
MHWVLVGIVVLLLFGGRGKISELMGDFAKGIKSFKKGMSEEPETAATDPNKPAEPVKTINHQPSPATTPSSAPADLAHRAQTEKRVEGTTS